MESAFTQRTIMGFNTSAEKQVCVSKCGPVCFSTADWFGLSFSLVSTFLYKSNSLSVFWGVFGLFFFGLFLQNINHSCHGRHFSGQTLSPQQSQQARHHRALQHSLQLGYVVWAWEHLVFSFIMFAELMSKRKEMIKESLDGGSDNLREM